MIIGTAGHIDHGKTSLVRALTGVDTDRLPEEKARGISIALGYAYLPVGEGRTLGFVDVPGHEKFIHTMIAGATGIDFMLLVVAADDGVMPQTREHVAIMSLLGVTDAAVAITKIDAVDPARVAACGQEVRALLAATPFGEPPLFMVSAKTGDGIDALKAHLEAAALAKNEARREGAFRLAVDRSFTMAGIGTIVTGTVYSGEVRVGDQLVVLPSGKPVRVRSVRGQGREADVVGAGERCALNLAAIAREEVNRGDWAVDPSIAIVTERFDGTLRLDPDAGALPASAEVHVHVAAAHTTGRLVPLGEGFVQVVLRAPISVWRGDRFVVRDSAATRTLGGGIVVDPLPPLRYRRTPQRLAVLKALDLPTPREQLAALVADAELGVDVRLFAKTGNVAGASALADALAGTTGVRHVSSAQGEFAIADRAWRTLADDVLAALAKFHASHGDLLGPDRSRLRRIALPKLDATLYRALIDGMIDDRELRESAGIVHLPSHDNALTPQERRIVDRVLPKLSSAGFDPPWVRDLAKELNANEVLVRTALIRAAKRGELYQVVHDLFYHPEAIAGLALLATEVERDDGFVTAASFRDRSGLGRKRAIQVLEYFDRIGHTRRIQDRRTIRPGSPLAAATA